MRALLWLGAIPFLGGVLANIAAIRIHEAGGHGENESLVWLAPPVVTAGLVALLVRWLASRRAATSRRALRWGLGAGAMTVAFSALPFVLYLVLCGDCW
jgi:peptidoglycan biosynthesis protein MviN/MurJ (putative lipid II flippase)